MTTFGKVLKMKKMFSVAAAVAVTAGVLAAPAGAFTTSTSWICDTLESSPNKAGVMSVILQLIDQGYTDTNGGPELFVKTVVTQCPEYIPVVKAAVDDIAG